MIDGLTERYELAKSVAAAAGKSTLEYFRGDFGIERKSDNSPVTIADRNAEQLARKLIEAAFPDDPILGEEFPDKEGNSPFRWIIDPIDGTKSFVSGVPLYSTLIGVEYQGRGVVGVIELPALGESVSAAEGEGAWCSTADGKVAPAKVGSFSSLKDGLFTTSERKTFDKRDAGDVYLRLEANCFTARTWGDGFGYYLVATGRAAVMVDPIMSVWDAAAILPILQEAGGVFTDWKGNPTIHGGEGIGTTKELLPEVLRLVAGD